MKRTQLSLVVALALGISATSISGGALAQSSGDMKAQIEALQRQLEMLKQRLDKQEAQQAQAPAQAQAAAPAGKGGHEFLERKDSDDVTFLTRGGEVTVYGNLALSLQTSSNGLSGMVVPAGVNHTGDKPVGKGGSLAAIGSDISYVGIKGLQKVGSDNFNFVYQLETQIDVSSVAGTGYSNSASSNTVKGGLTSRNSFIGLASPTWGAVKLGKTDAPYKNSTSRMNAFSGMLGDYSAVMGNSGGDNRVEFGTRLDHSIWYESPNWSGFTVNALFSPGQNRSPSNDNLAAGESDCAGGNAPISGITLGGGGVAACTDGAYGNAASASLAFSSGPLYVTAAYEVHKGVNRTSDQGLASTDPTDIADEAASKIAIQYLLPTKTTVSAIYEKMTRNLPNPSSTVAGNSQNERQRSGYWLAISQALTAKDSLHFGWAHANKALGDPGAHNTTSPLGNGSTANADNAANMYTLAWRHAVDKQLSVYADLAETKNHQYAHYDLGAGGRSITTDCHDATVGDPNYSGNGTCYAGATLKGIELGIAYKF